MLVPFISHGILRIEKDIGSSALLRIVVLEPGITEDHVLPSETGDSKKHPFRVGFVMENYVYYFGDLTCLIGGAIYIVH